MQRIVVPLLSGDTVVRIHHLGPSNTWARGVTTAMNSPVSRTVRHRVVGEGTKPFPPVGLA